MYQSSYYAPNIYQGVSILYLLLFIYLKIILSIYLINKSRQIDLNDKKNVIPNQGYYQYPGFSQQTPDFGFKLIKAFSHFPGLPSS